MSVTGAATGDGAAQRSFPVVSACVVYIALFAGSGLNQPYLPIWLAERGLSEADIAIALSAPMLLRIVVTPAVGALSDRAGNALTVRILALLVVATALLLARAQGVWTIIALATAMMLFSQAVPPIVDATTLSLIRQGVARDFGRIRLWGSASFAAASALGGFVLGWGGPGAVFSAFVAAAALQVATSFILPKAATPRARDAPARLRLLSKPLLLVVFIVAALVLASHATFNSFGSIHLRHIGFAEPSIGLLWALATSAEIAMFWAGPLLARRLDPFALLALAAGAAVCRWLLMSLSPGLAITAALQLFHAATFSGSYLGLMRFVQANVDDAVGVRAQSAFVTLLGVMMAAATLAAGPLYRQFGAAVFQATALLPLAALILLLCCRRPLQAASARS